jgi:3-oxoacyl-[acyl-carrier-protein] synthase II
MTRVVVSGVGAITPLGNDAPATWEALLAGKSGIDYATAFDASPFGGAIVGEVKDFEPEKFLPPKDLRYLDRNVQLGAVAALEAVKDAHLFAERPLGPRCGVFFGAGAGGYILLEEQATVFRERGIRRVSPFFLSNILPDAVSGYNAILSGATGPNLAVVAACATGAAANGEAAEVIRRGDADIMIAGGCEAPLTPMLYAGFAARDGFIVAEGAGALVLESLEHARARRHTPYAEIIGYGSSNDAFDMVASEEDGRGPVLAIEMALRKAEIDLRSVGYVNAHGTGTPMNDRVETQALKQVFGEHAYNFAVSSTKSMTGHMMGAAGAVEAVFTVLALRDQIAPPTMHYEVPDPDCDLDYVPNAARPMQDLDVALSTSIGLGGHNAALLFRRL